MIELLLFLHVITGVAAIVASLHTLVPGLAKLESAFWPSVAAVSTSGVGLLFTGVSIARVCVSGVLMTAALVAIHYLSVRKVAAVRISTK